MSLFQTYVDFKLFVDDFFILKDGIRLSQFPKTVFDISFRWWFYGGFMVIRFSFAATLMSKTKNL